MNIKTWNIEEMIGYKPFTTYFEDFSIADMYGIKAIQETFDKNFKQAKELGYKYLTEFVMACNWKIFEHYEHDNDKANLYNKLWTFSDSYACENLKGEALKYYYRVTD